MRKSYESTITKHLKNSTFSEVIDVFAEVEFLNSILERIDCNAHTFKMFRNFGSGLVDQPTLRECKKGLAGRIFTAEIWFNNKLKDGQLKLFSNKIESVDDDDAN